MRPDSWEADDGFHAVQEMLKTAGSVRRLLSLLTTGWPTAPQAITRPDSVPDMLLTGYDNSDYARHSVPKLSSVEINVPLMAKATFNELINQITTGEVLPIKIQIPVRLVIRDSVRNLKQDE